MILIIHGLFCAWVCFSSNFPFSYDLISTLFKSLFQNHVDVMAKIERRVALTYKKAYSMRYTNQVSLITLNPLKSGISIVCILLEQTLDTWC